MTGHWRVPSEYIQYNVSWFVETDPHSIQIFKTFTVSVVVFHGGNEKNKNSEERQAIFERRGRTRTYKVKSATNRDRVL